MATLVRFDSSPMGEKSISRKLTSDFVETWLKAHPDGKVIKRDLSALRVPAIDRFWVAAAYTPEDARTEEQKDALAISDSLIAELQHGDEYVFGVPIHNFSIPSTLKLWIDQIVRAGKTFAIGPNGATGLLAGKKATVLIASGGVYEQGGAAASMNFVGPYLRTLFGFLGFSEVKIIAAEGTAQLRSGKMDTQAFLAPTLEKVQAHASL